MRSAPWSVGGGGGRSGCWSRCGRQRLHLPWDRRADRRSDGSSGTRLRRLRRRPLHPPPPPPATADAGPLTGSNVPPPTAIGEGWTTNTQPPPGSHGQTGTSWLSARDPADVTAALVPLGCSGLRALPRYPLPDHALQGRYVSDQDGLNAVVLVLDYTDEVVARSFLGAFSRDISSCPAPATSGPRSPYVRAITVTEATDTRVVDHWSEFGAGAGTSVWHEVSSAKETASGWRMWRRRPARPRTSRRSLMSWTG